MKEYVYYDEQAVFEALEARFCCYCDLSHFQADISAWSCPCEYDITDKNCPHNDCVCEIEEIVAEELNKQGGK